jgi:hypothetical protein
VARILSSLPIPGGVPLIAEIASLKPPAISPSSARVELFVHPEGVLAMLARLA